MTIRAAMCIGLITMMLFCGHAARAQHGVEASTFDAMKELVGHWRVADKPDSPLRIRFSLTAGGTVLVEEWKRGDQPHSLTLYHRDGASVVATHYCPQGNQPRLALVSKGSAKEVRFAFRDGTGLDTKAESYLVALSFDLPETGVLVRRETYRQRGKNDYFELRLVREQE